MKNIRTLVIGLAVVGLMSASSVRASFVSIGDPVETGSWTQGIRENGVGLFNKITGTMITGLFDWPVSAGFTASGWSADALDNTTYAGISGPTTSDLNYFTAHFAGASSAPLSLYLYACNNNTLVDKAIGSYNGSAWGFTPLAVPEPTTMIAGALLLLPFGASTLRMLRKNRTA